MQLGGCYQSNFFVWEIEDVVCEKAKTWELYSYGKCQAFCQGGWSSDAKSGFLFSSQQPESGLSTQPVMVKHFVSVDTDL